MKTLPPAVYPPEQWRVAKALFRVLSRALAELQLVFARRGECDFAELGLLAQTALDRTVRREDLNAALGMKLRHLLVDEMQDTSTSQYELIELLTQGWDGQSQTVFLVGDPKQSIYLFRQARVERFVRMMRRQRMLGDLPLGSLRLTANFRSQRSWWMRSMRIFLCCFRRRDAELPRKCRTWRRRRYGERSKSGARSVVWHAQVLDPDEDAKKERRRQARAEAEQVRAIVEDWRARPLPEGRSRAVEDCGAGAEPKYSGRDCCGVEGRDEGRDSLSRRGYRAAWGAAGGARPVCADARAAASGGPRGVVCGAACALVRAGAGGSACARGDG